MKRAVYSLAALALFSVGATASFAVSISIGSATGTAGSTVVVAVTLDTEGTPVAGTQNDILFDATLVDLSSRFSCRINPEIGLGQCTAPDDPCKTLNSHLGDCPDATGCPEDSDGLRRFRGMLFAGDNVNQLPNGSLYSCEFQIGPTAATGSTAVLTCSNSVASGPAGNRLSVSCSGGEILVMSSLTPTPTRTSTSTQPPTQTPTATPTFTPTSTPTSTATETPTSTPSETPTSTPTTTHTPTNSPTMTFTMLPGSCPGDCDGNEIVTIDELIAGINIALGNDPLSTCSATDQNDDTIITVDELVQAINSALDGCFL